MTPRTSLLDSEVKMDFKVNVYFLTILSSIFSALLLYLLILGPLLILVPWTLFFILKRNSSYFHQWTYFDVLKVFIGVYICGVLLGMAHLGIFISLNQEPIIWIPYLMLLLGTLLHSLLLFSNQILKKEYLSFTNALKISVTFLFTCGFLWFLSSLYFGCGLSNMVYYQSKPLVSLHLALGADVNSKMCSTHPLRWSGTSPAITQLLIENQVNIHTRMEDKNTALHYASRANSLGSALYLLKAGADVNATNNNQRTPLFEAVQTQNIDLVRALIEFGAKINHQDTQGNSPLHMLGQSDHELFTVLVEAGANPKLLNHAGCAPLQCEAN